MTGFIHSFLFSKIKEKIILILQKLRIILQKLHWSQVIVLIAVFLAIVLTLLALSLNKHRSVAQTGKEDSRLYWEGKTKATPKNEQVVDSFADPQAMVISQLQLQLKEIQDNTNTQLMALKQQLSTLQSGISTVASQNDVEQLQATLATPNPMLLGKVDTLQTSIQKIIQQTAKVQFVDPHTVGKYFQLVAVQGFSDGMRAIIDVNGNQTTLSVNEVCPACRGWTLTSMDFSNQTATFEKNDGLQDQYVKLQAK